MELIYSANRKGILELWSLVHWVFSRRYKILNHIVIKNNALRTETHPTTFQQMRVNMKYWPNETNSRAISVHIIALLHQFATFASQTRREHILPHIVSTTSLSKRHKIAKQQKRREEKYIADSLVLSISLRCALCLLLVVDKVCFAS